MVKNEEGMKKRQPTGPERECIKMDAGGDHGSAAKGSAADLEATGHWSGLIGCHFPIFSSFFTMCTLSLIGITMVRRPSSATVSCIWAYTRSTKQIELRKTACFNHVLEPTEVLIDPAFSSKALKSFAPHTQKIIMNDRTLYALGLTHLNGCRHAVIHVMTSLN